MYNSDEYENYGDNLFFLKHIINSPEYTKILGHNDLKEMIDKLDRVSKKFSQIFCKSKEIIYRIMQQVYLVIIIIMDILLILI